MPFYLSRPHWVIQVSLWHYYNIVTDNQCNLLLCEVSNFTCLFSIFSLIARSMGPTRDPSGADRTQVVPMLDPWTLLSGLPSFEHKIWNGNICISEVWWGVILVQVCKVIIIHHKVVRSGLRFRILIRISLRYMLTWVVGAHFTNIVWDYGMDK